MLKLLLIASVLISTPVFAAKNKKAVTAKNNADQKVEAKAIMDGVYDSFVKVIPYVYSDIERGDLLFRDAGKKQELIKNLTDISEFFKSAKHVEYFQRPGFRPSLETINVHVEDTIRAVRNNNFVFAQKRMKAMTSLCISCHSQLSEAGSKNAFEESLTKTKRERFESDYAYANYLYLVRQFSESEKYFNRSIDSALEKSNSQELFASMRKGISIHTKIDYNYKKAMSFIQKYKNNKNLPMLAKNTFLNWEASLKKWEKFDPKKVKSAAEFIKTYLEPLLTAKIALEGAENDITYLIASGVLSKSLNDNPKGDHVPETLYWLAIAERRLSETYFYSLSDLYLKDCIQLYPSSTFAKMCYDEYAENIEFGYSGSGGTDIPMDEKRELERLKLLLK